MDAIKILESILGNNATGSKRIEQMSQQQGGGLGEILGAVLGGGGGASRGGGGAGISDLLGGLLGGGPGGRPAPAPAPPVRAPEPPPQEELDRQAVILIRAMCNAAKVDGQIDEQEQQAILSRLGDVTQDEIDFVRGEISSPLDVGGFCKSVPPNCVEHAYAFSVMAIKLDNLNEAAYLGRLAQGLDLDSRTCNQIHQQVGAPTIFV